MSFLSDFTLTPSLLFFVGLSLLVCYVQQVLETRSLVSFGVCLGLPGLTFYVTQDPVSGLIIFSLIGLFRLRDSVS